MSPGKDAEKLWYTEMETAERRRDIVENKLKKSNAGLRKLSHILRSQVTF